jgi:hypothetical protein
MDPVIARKTWRTVEPLHGLVYFAPEPAEGYVAAGLEPGQMGYFASRAAPMGPVPAEVVIATFFNFNPALVRQSIPRAWSLASPDDLVRARAEGADAALRRVLGGDAVASPEMAEAADLARTAALVACEHPEGRPLFAGNASLDWPDGPPHLVLFHAQTLLREFRGDGHVAALTLAGLTAREALVLHEASDEVPRGFLQLTRGWADREWAETIEELGGRGWVSPTEHGPVLTDAGRALRQEIEDRTDVAALAPYAALGEERCRRLRETARPFSKVAASALGPATGARRDG